MKTKLIWIASAAAIAGVAHDASAIQYSDPHTWRVAGDCNQWTLGSFEFGDNLLIFLPAHSMQVDVPTASGRMTEDRTCTIAFGFDLQPGDYEPVANQFLSYQVLQKSQFATAKFRSDGVIGGVPLSAEVSYPAGVAVPDNTIGTVASAARLPRPDPHAASCLGLKDKSGIYRNTFSVSGSVINNLTDRVRAGLLPGQAVNLTVTISPNGNGPICEHDGGQLLP